MSRECCDGVESRRIVDKVQVVQYQDDWPANRRQSRPRARNDSRLDRSSRCRKRIEHPRVERRDAIRRDRDVAQKDDRVVVRLIDVHPREWAFQGGCPLSRQCRLPPAGAGGHENDRSRTRAFQHVDGPCARHRPEAALRGAQLRLEQLRHQRTLRCRTRTCAGRWAGFCTRGWMTGDALPRHPVLWPG